MLKQKMQTNRWRFTVVCVVTRQPVPDQMPRNHVMIMAGTTAMPHSIVCQV